MVVSLGVVQLALTRQVLIFAPPNRGHYSSFKSNGRTVDSHVASVSGDRFRDGRTS